MPALVAASRRLPYNYGVDEAAISGSTICRAGGNNMNMNAVSFLPNVSDAVAVHFDKESTIFFWRERIIAVKHDGVFYRCDAKEDGILFRRIRSAQLQSPNTKVVMVNNEQLRAKMQEAVAMAGSRAITEVMMKEK
jgi:hypothetical protein